MGRRLIRTVIVRNDRHEAVAFGPNDDVPAWAAEQITNPDVWADDEPTRSAEAVAEEILEHVLEPDAPLVDLVLDADEDSPGVEVDAFEQLEPELEPTVDPVEKPAANGSTKAWRAYAVAQGMSEEDAQRRNRDELVALYGS